MWIYASAPKLRLARYLVVDMPAPLERYARCTECSATHVAAVDETRLLAWVRSRSSCAFGNHQAADLKWKADVPGCNDASQRSPGRR